MDNFSKTTGQTKWRIERKFCLGSNRIAVPSLLDTACQPDPEFPENWVHTVHFDTPNLEAYRACLDGEFRKKKARARWYADEPGILPYGWCGPEVKMRRGRATGKAIGNKFWLNLTSHNEVLEPHVWQDCFGSLTLDLGPIIPVLWSCYHRLRFLDPWTGARISLDTNIRGLAFNWRCQRGAAALQTVELETAVLEVKTPEDQFPPFLFNIPASQSGYSKYEKLITTFLMRIR
jgi:hypothetical protein